MCKCSQFLMNMLIRIVVHFTVHFFRITFVLVKFQVLLFVYLRRHFVYILFQGYTWVLGRSRAGGTFKSNPLFINYLFFASRVTSLELLLSV